MFFDIDFFCTDLRPIRSGKDKPLVRFMKPLHESNKRILPQIPLPFYRNIGSLSTKKKSLRTFFKARNSIKFPLFVKHRFSVPKSDFIFFRRDCVHRHFSTDAYGVVNRLKIGVQFTLERRLVNCNKTTSVEQEQKNTFELINFLLNMEIKTKGEDGCTKLHELLPWMTKIVSDSTKRNWSIFNFSIKRHKTECIDKNVHSTGMTAVLMYEDGELQELPSGTVSFDITNYPQNVKISYYDYLIDGIDNCRLYFIKHSEGCDTEFLNKLKLNLIDMRIHYCCLEEMKNKISLVLSKQIRCVQYIRNKTKISDDKRYSFIDLKNRDSGEIMEDSIRNSIDVWYEGISIPIN